jgi:hypothetical protein
MMALGWAALAVAAEQPAQPPAEEVKVETMEDILFWRMDVAVLRQTLVTEAMDLTPAEMQTFWPLYREYRLDAARIGDRVVALTTTFADSYDILTDEAADKLLAEFVGIEQARARLKEEYLPKFKKVLPSRKVARFYQIENKLDISVLAELSDQIPLAR